MKNLKEKRGITLIALIVTIIVLLILAGVTISTLTGDNGLLTKAGEAKSQSEIAEEKDIISISAIQAQAENKQGNLEENNFNQALNQNSKDGNKASIIASDISGFTVKFESNRYYEVDKNGNINYIENVTGEKKLTIQCINSKNEVLGEYEYTIVSNSYSKLPPSVNKYEASEEIIQGEITANKTIQVLYYLICNDDTTLVFTGLDSSGNITENENSIVSYMVGDRSSKTSNALKDPSIKSTVIIPNSYRNKPITIIGSNAFAYMNLKYIVISDSVNVIESGACLACQLKTLTIGRGVNQILGTAFYSCQNLEKIIYNNDSTVIQSTAFYNCSSWKEIELNIDNKSFKVENNILYSYDWKTIIKVPQGIEGNIEIKDQVETIGKTAFYSCNKINTISMHNNIEKIESAAFAYCNVQSMNITDSIKTIESGAFTWCGMRELIIGQGVTQFAGNACYSCHNLEKVINNNNINFLTTSAFYDCPLWTKIETNNSNYKIENNILYSSDGKVLVRVPEGMKDTVEIINTVETIGDLAFYDCAQIKEVRIGEKINTIGSNAFSYCSQLKTIYIDSNNISKNINSNNSQGNLVNSADTIYIKNTVTEIGNYIRDNYQIFETDKEGYVKYVKK